MTLQNFILNPQDPSLKCVSEIGSMLFTRGVSGTRVITGRDEKIFDDDHVFKGEDVTPFPRILLLITVILMVRLGLTLRRYKGSLLNGGGRHRNVQTRHRVVCQKTGQSLERPKQRGGQTPTRIIDKAGPTEPPTSIT